MQQDQVTFLKNMGIPREEIDRLLITGENIIAADWPPQITGYDLLPQLNDLVPDTGWPPYFQPNTLGPTSPFESYATPDPLGSVKTNYPKSDSEQSRVYNVSLPPYFGDDTNWLGLANDMGSETPTVGITGFNLQKSIPEWRYNIEDSQMMPIDLPPIAIYPSGMLNETEPIVMEYVYQSHDHSDVCAAFSGKTFNMNDRSHRPVPPSEGLGYTNTHPNCQCYWKPTGKTELDNVPVKDMTDLQTVHRKIGAKAHAGTLHKVKKEGELSQKTGHRNYYRKPLKMLREVIMEIRHEFGWLTDDYIGRATALAAAEGGVLYLIRASQESITDHRAEGEQYRRKLDGMELMAMARTAINHGTDINHNPLWRTESIVLDSEYDPYTKSIQMLVLERDPEINNLIANGSISAVSINGGAPRTESVEPCDSLTGELCNVPRGVVLGELDGIAFTWVVTDPRGIVWRGIPIPAAEPGVKTTAIQPVSNTLTV
jgi:hypothetical protein